MLMFFTESIEMHPECREFIRAKRARIPGKNSTYPLQTTELLVPVNLKTCPHRFGISREFGPAGNVQHVSATTRLAYHGWALSRTCGTSWT